MIRVLMVLALGSCVTTVGVVKRDHVTVPFLIGALAADLVITPILVGESTDLSAGASITAGIAFAVIDFGVGCIVGACSVLRP